MPDASTGTPPTVLITKFLPDELLERIRSNLPGARVLYDPDLVPPPRFPGDQVGPKDFRRSAEQEDRFRSHLAEAEVIYGFDRPTLPELGTLAPRLRWIQATFSGIGKTVERAGLHDLDIVITNAAGVHAVPLAEHVVLSMLYFVRDVPQRLADGRAKRWEAYASRELRGRTHGIVGVGGIGVEVARLSRALGMRVLGSKRSAGDDPASLGLERLYRADDLHAMLPECDVLTLILPHTPETEGLIGERELALLPQGAILINIGRGVTVDEEALLAALRSGHLRGAALDVTAVEPLPPESPLWEQPNVYLTAHSAATSERENERLVELFCDNLQRFAEDRPLRNVFRR